MSQAPDDALFRLIRPERLTGVVDIGANPVGGDPPYKAMFEQGLCTVVGFEPQESAFALLSGRGAPRARSICPGPSAMAGGTRCTSAKLPA